MAVCIVDSLAAEHWRRWNKLLYEPYGVGDLIARREPLTPSQSDHRLHYLSMVTFSILPPLTVTS